MKRKQVAWRLFVGALLLASSPITHAGGWSATAGVDRLEIVRDDGLVVFGAFGNPNGCSDDAGLWIKIDHPQYNKIYSLAIAAMTSGLRLKAYARGCDAIGWHGGTWNYVGANDAVNNDAVNMYPAE